MNWIAVSLDDYHDTAEVIALKAYAYDCKKAASLWIYEEYDVDASHQDWTEYERGYIHQDDPVVYVVSASLEFTRLLSSIIMAMSDVGEEV